MIEVHLKALLKLPGALYPSNTEISSSGRVDYSEIGDEKVLCTYHGHPGQLGPIR